MTDHGWFDARGAESGRRYDGVVTRSFYLRMRDGVEIAIDLWLPEAREPDDRLPAIVHMTRYMRSVELRGPLRRMFLNRPFDHTTLYRHCRRRFVRHGYAWLDVDVRGSGASFGSWIAPWNPFEVRDSAEIVDWIIAQPWSNGRVGATGISYDGSASEMLAVNRHPAVKAVAPRFASFEPYLDIAYPGGVFHERFIHAWHTGNDALDRNAPHEVAGQAVRLVITGVTPVDDDLDRTRRATAVAQHRNNCDVVAMTAALPFRDSILETHPFYQVPDWRSHLVGHPHETEPTHAIISGHNYTTDIDASGAAVYAYSGWFDGGYPHAAIKRHMTLHHPANRLVIGPWNHGGGWDCDPSLGAPRRSSFDHTGELLRFFERHLRNRDTGIDHEPRVHYYTMGEGRWKSAASWPPPGITEHALYLSERRTLSVSPPDCAGCSDEHVPDYGVGTGATSRWSRLTEPDKKVDYGDRARVDARMLCYTTAPLTEPMEVTGHPIVQLFVRSTADDGHFFAYLEDVEPCGRVRYVTEGMLRALHRAVSDERPPYAHAVPYHSYRATDARPLVPGETAELVFDLLPVSYLFRRGHRVRLALAGADVDQFKLLPATPPIWQVMRHRGAASRVVLPVMRDGAGSAPVTS